MKISHHFVGVGLLSLKSFSWVYGECSISKCGLFTPNR